MAQAPLEKALEILDHIFGHNSGHPSQALVMSNLAWAHYERDEMNKALSCCEKAYKWKHEIYPEYVSFSWLGEVEGGGTLLAFFIPNAFLVFPTCPAA